MNRPMSRPMSRLIRRSAGLGLSALLACLGPLPCSAGLSRSELAEVRADAPPDAALPLDTPFKTSDGRDTSLREALGGRPALLVPVDYECRALCGPALALVAGAAETIPARLGADYRIVAVGMDPHETPDQAQAMLRRSFGEADPDGVTALLGSAPSIRTVLAALGYSIAYDAQAGRYAHPAAAYAITAEGRVARPLSTFALDATGLRLALADAGEGRIGGLGDRLALLCYGFDPALGTYTPAIRRALACAGALAVAALALSILALSRAARRRGAGSAP